MPDSLNQETGFGKITADTYEDCVKELRSKYGLNNYRIDNHREVSAGGFRGLFLRKTKHEMTYYLLPSQNRQRIMPRTPQPVPESGTDFEQRKKQIFEVAGKIPNQQLVDISKKLEKLEQLDEKLDKIAQQKAGITVDIHPAIQKTEKFLAANDFTPAIVKQISQRLEQDLSLEELNNIDIVRGKVDKWISELIKIEKQPVRPRKPRVIVLVGPTGEGKTTTIAKFVADNRKKYTGDNDQNICMVTIDQFRVAAGKQIETYAQLLNAKSESANSADDIRKIAALYSDTDLLLIDTAGYSPKDFGNIGQMRKILDIPELYPEIYLTVSASKTASAIMDIFKNYDIFDYKAVIVTKMDETDHIGNVVSVLAEKNKSVAYITTGQKVSSDIKEADPLDFLQKLTDKNIWSE
jgi:flagellar biosynthesis protein FlhF